MWTKILYAISVISKPNMAQHILQNLAWAKRCSSPVGYASFGLDFDFADTHINESIRVLPTSYNSLTTQIITNPCAPLKKLVKYTMNHSTLVMFTMSNDWGPHHTMRLVGTSSAGVTSSAAASRRGRRRVHRPDAAAAATVAAPRGSEQLWGNLKRGWDERWWLMMMT